MATDRKIRLLLVEDDTTLAGVISDVLSESGFDVILAKNGAEALGLLVPEDRSAAGMPAPEIIVTDIMMPKTDGFTMVRSLREKGCDIPVLFLSARTGTEDVVKGFSLGAGDYIRKPFAMKELIVRIHSLLNRHATPYNTDGKSAEPCCSTSDTGSVERTSGTPAENRTEAPLPGTADNPFRIGRYRFDSVHRRLWLVPDSGHIESESEGENSSSCVQLPAMESEILEILCSRMGTVVPNSLILNKLWGHDDYFSTRSLNVHITRLRKRLKADPSVSIDSFRGNGYRLSL